MQEEAPKKRLQQFTTNPNWGLVGNEKVLTSEALRTSALDAFPDLRHPAANRLFAALRSCPSLSAAT